MIFMNKKKERKLSRLQEIILIYLKPMIDKEKTKYIKRTEFVKKLIIVLDKQQSKSFNVVFSQSIRSLIAKKLVSRRYSNIGLTLNGRVKANNTTKHFKYRYGVVNLKNIKQYYLKEKE